MSRLFVMGTTQWTTTPLDPFEVLGLHHVTSDPRTLCFSQELQECDDSHLTWSEGTQLSVAEVLATSPEQRTTSETEMKTIRRVEDTNDEFKAVPALSSLQWDAEPAKETFVDGGRQDTSGVSQIESGIQQCVRLAGIPCRKFTDG
ncbi:hypothetical protein BCON_0636g00010 [Botryotinia convoluta]|uniref:Uncharacterized protein n=1 Tax=Botryotinia convoluta TaxID=54673 RepID=A0A4Z1H7H9_9HELO|nr:hypothetical protein BCON_0636g00010 [Botryotinia convoluta]